MKKRIIGINIARAIAVIGMIIVNFKIILGETGNNSLKTLVSIFDGKAAATFVVLAGVGLALMTNSVIKNQNPQQLKAARNRIIKRALFLFIIGLSYIKIWPADILHFYGIYMIATLFFINKKPKQAIVAALALILIYPFLLAIFNYETGWNFITLEYKNFFTLKGFLRNLFYNGFHPVIPWTAFMLIGLWFGKQNISDKKFIKKTLIISAVAFTLTQLVSYLSIRIISKLSDAPIKSLTEILGTSPMPPLPIYMLNGIFAALTIISASILISQQFKNSKIIKALDKTGQLALTFYVAHIIFGIGIVEAINPSKLGKYSIEFSITYALIFSLLCILFSIVWLRYKKTGPLEFIIRKITD
ncbi:MAG: DUF1624 domain-containing protein [Deltaproteobacteria bacterium]|nr:DUF1624 domain-containing protein [Deltaproteobacteria bacterium]